MEKENLATELLQGVKASARRWFIIAMVELCAIVVLIIFLFVIPSSTTEEVMYDQNMENVENATQRIGTSIGDTYGEDETDCD